MGVDLRQDYDRKGSIPRRLSIKLKKTYLSNENYVAKVRKSKINESK